MALAMQSFVYGPKHTRWEVLRLSGGSSLCKAHEMDRAHCDACAATWGETWKEHVRKQSRQNEKRLAQEFCTFRTYMNRKSGNLRSSKARGVFRKHPDWAQIREGLLRVSVTPGKKHKVVVLHYKDREEIMNYKRCFFPEC